jgi:hypothetical protein
VSSKSAWAGERLTSFGSSRAKLGKALVIKRLKENFLPRAAMVVGGGEVLVWGKAEGTLSEAEMWGLDGGCRKRNLLNVANAETAA